MVRFRVLQPPKDRKPTFESISGFIFVTTIACAREHVTMLYVTKLGSTTTSIVSIVPETRRIFPHLVYAWRIGHVHSIEFILMDVLTKTIDDTDEHGSLRSWNFGMRSKFVLIHDYWLAEDLHLKKLVAKLRPKMFR